MITFDGYRHGWQAGGGGYFRLLASKAGSGFIRQRGWDRISGIRSFLRAHEECALGFVVKHFNPALMLFVFFIVGDSYQQNIIRIRFKR